mmetsp:Transcript_20741/g.38950  ORF Transcript_20741/g.38950 Transcript_20741/m.38950 type:complete len:198 (+) Transcript_20741:77-670(+)
MVPPNRFSSILVALVLHGCTCQCSGADDTKTGSVREEQTLEESLNCEASFLQHGLDIQQVIEPPKQRAPKQVPPLTNLSRASNGTLNLAREREEEHTLPPKQEGHEQDAQAVLLNQLVAGSLARETAASGNIISTVVNIVVLVLLVGLIVLLCRHDGDYHAAYEEVKEDPQMLYKQFDQQFHFQDSDPRARCTQACC